MTKTKLQIMREKKGLTVIELAKKVNEIEPSFKVGIMAMTLASIEADGAGSNSDGTGLMVQVVAKALDCSVDELVEE
ncbi:helix-turn-helix domain-containing protein [Lactococcus petauri]|uniref:helix-turn-helix domain-containing protein n=1 Tax=Lactococcus petauri TaxID=1940789 RepID=UPI0022E20384|nr:helix-turn-helix transcriptional regulator [Lactococcus petauri]